MPRAPFSLPWPAARAGVLLAALLLAASACSDGKSVSEPTPVAADVEQGDTALADLPPEPEDTAVDTEPGPDLPPADDTDASLCPGGPGCACADNGDCDTGVCLDAAGGKECAALCVTDGGCAQGYACKQFGSGDGVFACVPKLLSLCAPCQGNADCQAQGVVEALCLDYGPAGKFCGGPCAADADCPQGYQCLDAVDAGTGKTSKQCRLDTDGSGADCAGGEACPDGETCQAGVCAATVAKVCPCSVWAQSTGRTTTCQASNVHGTCQGTRTCGPGGLGACSAKVAAVEVCNALDDDCDGKVDDLPAEATCTKKAFLDAGSQGPCQADGDCPAGEACDGGACKTLIGACPGTPSCTTGGVLVCLDAQVAKLETCNGADDDCDGQTDDLACDDKDACTTDACAAATGQCSHAPAIDCDDQDQCTTDTCDPATGACVHVPFVGSCTDGDACTVGDACALSAEGTATCLPGGQTPSCDDGNPCTDDSCDPAVGCVYLANAATLSCYDGLPAWLGVGTCQQGTKFCQGGQLGAACEGQVLPVTTELCDGLDDSCNGVVDEGCKAAAATLAVASLYGRVQGGDVALTVELGPGTPVGAGANDVHAVWLGLLAWLEALAP